MPSSSRRFACIHPNLLNEIIISLTAPSCASIKGPSHKIKIAAPCVLQMMLLSVYLHCDVCSSHLQHLQDCAHLDLLIPHLPDEL